MKLRTLSLSAAMLVALAGCSAGNVPPAGPTTPKVSVAEQPPSAAVDPEIEQAASFVTAIYTDDWDQAGTLVADNSVGARYVTHQAASAQVDELNGTSETTSPSDIDVTSDPAAKTVSIDYHGSGDPFNYIYKGFTFQDGKVASWEVEGQPELATRLWGTKSSDESKGVSAELVSAYQGNSKTLTAVVRLTSSSRDVRVTGAAYTPDDGFKHEDTASLAADVDKGGKTLTKFIFNKAPVGGKLKLTIDRIDSNDNSSSYSLTTLNLKVR